MIMKLIRKWFPKFDPPMTDSSVLTSTCSDATVTFQRVHTCRSTYYTEVWDRKTQSLLGRLTPGEGELKCYCDHCRSAELDRLWTDEEMEQLFLCGSGSHIEYAKHSKDSELSLLELEIRFALKKKYPPLYFWWSSDHTLCWTARAKASSDLIVKSYSGLGPYGLGQLVAKNLSMSDWFV